MVLRFFFNVLVLTLLLSGLSGCMQLSDGKPPGPWHDAYQPIEDAESEAFIAEALAKATAEFGAPAFPLNKVLLRRSTPVAEARRYRIGQNFSLTECVDSTNGIFVIYLAVDLDHQNYFPLLGHECAHLLNPQIIDWYMEGIATVFSEQMCIETDREWGDWSRHFMRTRREPYGLSYRMMLELKENLPAEYPNIIQHLATNGKGPDKLRIDIDGWLETLTEEQQQLALNVIGDYAAQLKKQASEQYYFTVPKALE
jgi:hypothetical protein